ncbi:MAG: DctP family TRAP transporter solute-binding subunit [Spirochaetaceae bacterium]|nr:DctP family TRAP transporter solute-binding subunit [Spirochaetaceae bacterium]
MRGKRFSATLFVMALCLCSAHGQILIRIAHLNPQDPLSIASAAMASVFKSEVEANSSGQIKVEIYPGGVSGKENESMVQVKSGMLQSFIATSGGIALAYPLIDIINMPFAFPSYNTAYKVLDGDFGKAFAADIREKTGYKVLGFGESGGFFAITNAHRQIRTPNDMRGLKIRTMALPVQQAAIRAVGATPMTVAWADVYQSLKTNIVDGQMNPASLIRLAKLGEVQKFMTQTNFLYSPYVWIMNGKFYDSLEPRLQELIDNAAAVAVLAGRGVSRTLDSSTLEFSTFEKEMQVYTLTPEETELFRKAMLPAARKLITERYGEEGTMWLKKLSDAIIIAEKK